MIEDLKLAPKNHAYFSMNLDTNEHAEKVLPLLVDSAYVKGRGVQLLLDYTDGWPRLTATEPIPLDVHNFITGWIVGYCEAMRWNIGNQYVIAHIEEVGLLKE